MKRLEVDFLCHFFIFLFFFFSGLWVDDDAAYVCEAHNVFGKIEAQARITVTGLGRWNVY